jgi:sec-independent protein translocase protein TatA
VIPGVPQVGGVELLILLTIILLFFGAKRVPELGKSLGKSMREFRKGFSEDLDEKDEARHLKGSSEHAPREEARASAARSQTAGEPRNV